MYIYMERQTEGYEYAFTHICEADCRLEPQHGPYYSPEVELMVELVTNSITVIDILDDSVIAEHEAGGEGEAAC